jgi:hypothetical protein
VRLKDNELASFGAEALPGGLSEINRARGGAPQARPPAEPAQPRTPQVGLIALVTHWKGRGRSRR